MAKIFYDHLVSLHDILKELDHHSLSHDEKVDLVRTVDTTIHYHVVDTILSHLPREKHSEFLDSFHQAPHDKKHLAYLKKHYAEIEKRIMETVERAKKEILQDLRSLRTNGKKKKA